MSRLVLISSSALYGKTVRMEPTSRQFHKLSFTAQIHGTSSHFGTTDILLDFDIEKVGASRRSLRVTFSRNEQTLARTVRIHRLGFPTAGRQLQVRGERRGVECGARRHRNVQLTQLKSKSLTAGTREAHEERLGE
jgi:hypothetical protein